jgi:hypothetical protein
MLGRHSAGLPCLAAGASPVHDFAFAAPFVGGLQGVNVCASRAGIGPGALAGGPLDAMVRSDGSVRPHFWNARLPLALLGAAASDFAAARAPADLAIGYSHVTERAGRWVPGGEGSRDTAAIGGCAYAARAQTLAQRLVRAGVAFDVLDLDAAAADELARYKLVVAPAAAVLARATQAKVANCDNLALLGDAGALYDEYLEPCDILASWGQQTTDYGLRTAPLRLPRDISGGQICELAESRGGIARYAWADAEDVDVSVRYGAEYTFLFVANRRTAPYNGTLTYRAPDGSIQHVHAGIGGPRVGMMLIKDDEVLGAAMGGDGAEGGWLARGMHTSIVFNNGAGVAAPCGAGLLFSAPQSGRFQVRRPSGWHGLAARRLLLSGALLPAAFQADGAHMLLPYTAEDDRGQTDLYILLPEGEPLPRQAHDHTATLLRARAHALRRAADLAGDPARRGHSETAGALARAAEIYTRAAGDLEDLAGRHYTIEEYGAAWDAAGAACGPAFESLASALARARDDHLAGDLDAVVYAPLEEVVTRVLGIVARWGL